MGVTALVMAGGRGSRFEIAVEKPLLRVGGKVVVERVVGALRDAKSVERVVVAVSGFTPLTAEFVRSLDIEVVETPGREYVFDMGFAVKKLGLGMVLTVGADLPLLSGEVVDDVVARFRICGKPALAVAVPSELRDRLGLGAGYAFDWCGRHVVYAGINVNDGSRIDNAELEQDVYILDRVEVAVNINTVDELRIAEEQSKLLRKT
jgi:adenosylcobinamide-phosphate guanylyltransferase